MAAYYLDTSALVKRYAREKGSAWIVRLTNPMEAHDLYTVRLTGPEMIAALFRKVRVGRVSHANATRLSQDFKTDWQRQYQIVEVNALVADRAMILAEKHSLRGYDAVHLAAALELHDLRCALQLPALTFLSADGDQIDAAMAEGLGTNNPNNHP